MFLENFENPVYCKNEEIPEDLIQWYHSFKEIYPDANLHCVYETGEYYDDNFIMYYVLNDVIVYNNTSGEAFKLGDVLIAIIYKNSQFNTKYIPLFIKAEQILANSIHPHISSNIRTLSSNDAINYKIEFAFYSQNCCYGLEDNPNNFFIEDNIEEGLLSVMGFISSYNNNRYGGRAPYGNGTTLIKYLNGVNLPKRNDSLEPEELIQKSLKIITQLDYKDLVLTLENDTLRCVDILKRELFENTEPNKFIPLDLKINGKFVEVEVESKDLLNSLFLQTKELVTIYLNNANIK